MKLLSKEICPVTVRDRLITTFANQEVCDLVEAVKWAEEKCLELDEKNDDLYAEMINYYDEAVRLQDALDKCNQPIKR